MSQKSLSVSRVSHSTALTLMPGRTSISPATGVPVNRKEI